MEFINNINNDSKKIHIKCVLLGDSGVGKTSIMERYIRNSFNPNSQTTLGAMFFTQNTIINDNIKLHIDFWDTAGQERYHSLVPMYVRDVDIVILTYDINNLNSFKSLEKWIKYIDNNRNREKIKIIIAGTKNDLENKVDENVVLNFIYNSHFVDFHPIRLSSKNNYNFDKLKENIINLSLSLSCDKVEINTENTTIGIPKKSKNRFNCC